MAMDFPVSPVDKLPIFTDEAASAAALMELIGASGRGDDESANGCRGAVGGGFGHGSYGQMLNGAACSEERTVAGGGADMSRFSESKGDNGEALDQAEGEAQFDGGQEAVIQDRTDSADGGSAQSTGKDTRWIRKHLAGQKRVRVGNQPPNRAPCPKRVGALQQTIRGYADKLGDHVVEPAIGLTFDSLGEAYDFYNLYSWEHGFGIRYGKSRLNAEKTKCMQEVVCGCSVSFLSSLKRFKKTDVRMDGRDAHGRQRLGQHDGRDAPAPGPVGTGSLTPRRVPSCGPIISVVHCSRDKDLRRGSVVVGGRRRHHLWERAQQPHLSVANSGGVRRSSGEIPRMAMDFLADPVDR